MTLIAMKPSINDFKFAQSYVGALIHVSHGLGWVIFFMLDIRSFPSE
jgi:hypothetical protein